MTQRAECPSCAAINEFGDELIGRYGTCPNCQCRFYIVVPPLDREPALPEPRTRPLGEKASAGQVSSQDILWESQQGRGEILKLLRQQQTQLASLNRRMSALLAGVAALLVFSAAAAALRIAFK